MKTVKAVLFGCLVVASVVTTAYSATTGNTPLRSKARATVVPPGLYQGTDRNDVIYGTEGPDVLLGRGGSDAIFGLRGNDVLRGGTGNDRLWGGRGSDYELGGPGNDRIYSRDGKKDVVNGGPGFDQAWVDRSDVVRNVERVYRR